MGCRAFRFGTLPCRRGSLQNSESLAACPALGDRGRASVSRIPDYEQAGLADQLRRACYSVPLNIAEGNTRYGSRECRRFLDTARGSLAEVETIIEMAKELEYVSAADYGRLEALTNETGRTLWGLLQRISGAAARTLKPRPS